MVLINMTTMNIIHLHYLYQIIKNILEQRLNATNLIATITEEMWYNTFLLLVMLNLGKKNIPDLINYFNQFFTWYNAFNSILHIG